MERSFVPTYEVPTLGVVYPDAVWTPSGFTVGAGQETDGLVEGVTHILTDFYDNALVLTLTTVLPSPTWNAAVFNGPVFTSLAGLGISSASVDVATTMVGFDASRVSFTETAIRINWQGLSYSDGTTVAINFTFDPAIVSEPASFLLFGMGILGIAAVRRRHAAHPRLD
jgi:hypothetical protein